MAEYIDREALIKALEADFNTDWADYASKNNFDKDYIDGVRDEYDDVLKIICKQRNLTDEETEIYNNRIEAEAADVQPAKRGKWINDGDCLICSCCKTAYNSWFTGSNYCAECGADMRGDENGTKT